MDTCAMKPKAMPSAILKVKGIRANAMKAGMEEDMSSQCILRTEHIIREPTSIMAGAVTGWITVPSASWTAVFTDATSGEKKRLRRKRTPTVTQ